MTTDLEIAAEMLCVASRLMQGIGKVEGGPEPDGSSSLADIGFAIENLPGAMIQPGFNLQDFITGQAAACKDAAEVARRTETLHLLRRHVEAVAAALADAEVAGVLAGEDYDEDTELHDDPESFIVTKEGVRISRGWMSPAFLARKFDEMNQTFMDKAEAAGDEAAVEEWRAIQKRTSEFFARMLEAEARGDEDTVSEMLRILRVKMRLDVDSE